MCETKTVVHAVLCRCCAKVDGRVARLPLYTRCGCVTGATRFRFGQSDMGASFCAGAWCVLCSRRERESLASNGRTTNDDDADSHNKLSHAIWTVQGQQPSSYFILIRGELSAYMSVYQNIALESDIHTHTRRHRHRDIPTGRKKGKCYHSSWGFSRKCSTRHHQRYMSQRRE